MTFILRHGAVKEGIEIGSDGFVLVSDLLAYQKLKKLGVNQEMIQKIVQDCEKQRFEMIKNEKG